jgi:hypothetical protein
MTFSNLRGEEPKKRLLRRFVDWVSWKTVLATIAALWIAPQLSSLIQSRTDARDLGAEIAQDIETAQADADSFAVFRAYDLDQRLLVGQLKFDDNGRLEPSSPFPDRQAFNETYRKWLTLDRKARTMLETYFESDQELRDADRWEAQAFGAWYLISGNTREPDYVDDLVSATASFNDATKGWSDSVPIVISSEDIAALRKGQNDSESIRGFYVAYNRVGQSLSRAQSAVIQRMLSDPPHGFTVRTCDFVSAVFIVLPPGALCV